MALKNYEERGILLHKGEITSGTTSKGSAWQNQTIVVRRDGITEGYADIVIKAFGERVDALAKIKEGSKVSVSFFITGKQWNDKWYNDVTLDRIQSLETAPVPTRTAPEESLEEQDGDLPF